MELTVFQKEDTIQVEYTPQNGISYILLHFTTKKELRIKNTFHITKQDLIEPIDNEDDSITFIIGRIENDYYKIFRKILHTKFDVLIHQSKKISIKDFILNSNKSILRRFEDLSKQQIVIGGDDPFAIPNRTFDEIRKSLPTRTELDHYIDLRITNVLSQYLEGVKDSENAFNKYLENRKKIVSINSIHSINEYELDKYSFILDSLRQMLENIDTYKESEWRDEILKVILILYPKYTYCLHEVQIEDSYSDSKKSIKRYVDLMLLDTNGNIDIIEIKKPITIFKKNKYRDNNNLKSELSGVVMQIEKYIFHLNKWGKVGEDVLSKRYQKKMHSDLTIHITNPKGIAIVGRDAAFSNDQRLDFEIIKRKYSNIIDIITYDDLVNRIENIVKSLKSKNIAT